MQTVYSGTSSHSGRSQFFIKQILYLQGSFFSTSQRKELDVFLMVWSLWGWPDHALDTQPISLKRLEVPCTAPLETLCRAIILC